MSGVKVSGVKESSKDGAQAQQIAEKSAKAMWAEDAASKWFGMKLVRIAPGEAELTLMVKPEHCNGHGTCHGAVSFALADSAFAFACNSYNERHVGQHNFISYLRPAREGDTLKAIASEQSRTRNSGIYDVRLTNQDGKPIAEMRGVSYRVGGELYEDKNVDGEKGENS